MRWIRVQTEHAYALICGLACLALRMHVHVCACVCTLAQLQRYDVLVRNAIKKVVYGLAGERSRLMNWPDPSPAQSLSLVVG